MGFKRARSSTMSMSAFEALRNENTPIYDANTSDEDGDLVLDSRANSFQPTPEPAPIIRQSMSEESKFICSNFTPDSENVIFGDDYILFGLKSAQSLILRGQFILKIQRGAVSVNNVIYHSSFPEMKFLNPVSNSLPLIQAAQVTNMEKVRDVVTDENEHLFHSDYKSVIRVSNLKTGLEDIGKVCPIFKNLFWNVENMPELETMKYDSFEKSFAQYSFFPILSPTNAFTLLNFRNWVNDVDKLTKIFASNTQSLRILIIGGKNSGKSTFLKLLLQNFLSEIQPDDNYFQPINVMDLDPGQSEFSKPDSISLNKFTTNQFGNHLSVTSTPGSVNHFIGFTSPSDQPKRYRILINDLIKRYNSDGLLKNETLLINTPGWIKGYGLNLTKELIEKSKPTHLIYLNSGNNQAMDQSLEDLSLDPSIEFLPLLGNYFNFSNTGLIKYSSSQLRIFKLLAYFHKLENNKFDFANPLLYQPPLQVSYGDHGVKAASVLNVNAMKLEDLESALTGTIVALHTVDKKLLDDLKVRSDNKSVPLIDSSELNKLDPVALTCKSLALIHSINPSDQLINLYIPSFEDLDKADNEEYILIRGSTEVPIWEIASKEIVKEFGPDLPFVSFDKVSGFDKIWKPRKNVQRRGQLQ